MTLRKHITVDGSIMVWLFSKLLLHINSLLVSLLHLLKFHCTVYSNA